MKPCPFFLDGKCKFYGDTCKFSHGHSALFSELQPFQDPDFRLNNLISSSKHCLNMDLNMFIPFHYRSQSCSYRRKVFSKTLRWIVASCPYKVYLEIRVRMRGLLLEWHVLSLLVPLEKCLSFTSQHSMLQCSWNLKIYYR